MLNRKNIALFVVFSKLGHCLDANIHKLDAVDSFWED